MDAVKPVDGLKVVRVGRRRDDDDNETCGVLLERRRRVAFVGGVGWEGIFEFLRDILGDISGFLRSHCRKIIVEGELLCI